jgi:integrase
MNLANKSVVAGLKVPAGRTELLVFDDKLHGFGIRMREGGSRVWILQYRVGQKQRRKTIGPVAVLDADKARAIAKRDLAAVVQGGDPQLAKAAERAKADETFGHFAKLFLDIKRKATRPRTFSQIHPHMTKHFAAFNNLSVHAIDRRTVAAQLTKIAAERGDVSSNRSATTLSSFFAWLIGEGIVDSNPVVGTNRRVETARDRALSDEDLTDVWQACREDHFGRIVKLLILTGARRDEVGYMGIPELDTKARLWTLPGARAKNHREHLVPLSDSALELIGQAIGGRESGAAFNDIVRSSGAAKGFSGWSRAKKSLDQRIAKARAADGREPMAPWIIHDLRRTAATGLARLGVQPHVIEAALNHKSGIIRGVAGIYNRADYLAEKRQALDMWAARVEALVEGRAANVVTMKRA